MTIHPLKSIDVDGVMPKDMEVIPHEGWEQGFNASNKEHAGLGVMMDVEKTAVLLFDLNRFHHSPSIKKRLAEDWNKLKAGNKNRYYKIAESLASTPGILKLVKVYQKDRSKDVF